MSVAPSESSQLTQIRQRVSKVICTCGHCICDSEGIIRSRCVKLHEGTALCRCKRWVKVPVVKKA